MDGKRTTLSIGDDVLAAARAKAEHEGRSVGSVVSELPRKSLQRPSSPRERSGIPLLSPRPNGGPVTLEIVNALRDPLPGHPCSTSTSSLR